MNQAPTINNTALMNQDPTIDLLGRDNEKT
jgi:hypothetical protein